MRSISIKQPHAEAIASGRKSVEYRTWRAPCLVGGDLLIVAPKAVMAGYSGEPTGVAVCVVRVVRMGGTDGDREWHFTDPRRVKPRPVRGRQALFRVPDQTITFVKAVKEPSGSRAARDKSRGRVAMVGPYTFSIGDRDIRGQSAKTPEAARALARELAAKYGTTITISRDGIAVSGEG